MRDLIVAETMSLDGVIDGTGGWFVVRGDDGRDVSDVDDAGREVEARRRRTARTSS